jgi:hypothetical protein
MQLCDDDIRFIKEHFPGPYNTPETFGDYLLPKIQHHDTLCSAVIAEVKKKYSASVIGLGVKSAPVLTLALNS